MFSFPSKLSYLQQIYARIIRTAFRAFCSVQNFHIRFRSTQLAHHTPTSDTSARAEGSADNQKEAQSLHQVALNLPVCSGRQKPLLELGERMFFSS